MPLGLKAPSIDTMTAQELQDFANKVSHNPMPDEAPNTNVEAREVMQNYSNAIDNLAEQERQDQAPGKAPQAVSMQQISQEMQQQDQQSLREKIGDAARSEFGPRTQGQGLEQTSDAIQAQNRTAAEIPLTEEGQQRASSVQDMAKDHPASEPSREAPDLDMER